MKAYKRWLNDKAPTYILMSREEETAKEGWRAALEEVLGMKISSAHCKTELDVLRDWIKNELEEE